jgi:ABC-type multidrug transport system fused ATPase/permease subunit
VIAVDGAGGDVLRLAWPHVNWLVWGCLALACRLPFSVAMPHFVSTVIGAAGAGDADAAHSAVIAFFVLGLADSIGDFFCAFLFTFCQQKIIRSLRVDLLAAILRQEVAFFDDTSTGDLTSRLTADCSEMANDLTWVFRFAIEATVRISLIVAYMFAFEPRLALVAIAIIPVVAAINKSYGDWLSANQNKVQASLANANTVAHEAVGSFRTVYSFAQEDSEHRRY